jgi:tRNA (cytidine32/uridine32-2'-O)-methyltransferase
MSLLEKAGMLQRVRIVLVETSHPGNIGATARAMKTMGLTDLVLVQPKRFPDPQALWRAAGGDDVLLGARVVDSLATAIADCHWVVATSARQRRIPWPILSPREFAAAAAQRSGQQVAVVFGREDKGLSNEELQLCQTHVEIPANPEYPILNVAMAVQVIAYELFQAGGKRSEPLEWDRPLAPHAFVEGFMGHLDAVLKTSKFVDAGNPGQTMTRFRRLFSRLEMDITEIAMLRGLLKQVCPEAGPGEVEDPN